MNGCCYSDNVEVYYGSTPKYKLEINAGLPMSEFDFEVKLSCGDNSLIVKKADMPVGDDGSYYVCFDTTRLGIGPVKAVVTAFIPDGDYSSRVRKEVTVANGPIIIKRT